MNSLVQADHQAGALAEGEPRRPATPRLHPATWTRGEAAGQLPVVLPCRSPGCRPRSWAG